MSELFLLNVYPFLGNDTNIKDPDMPVLQSFVILIHVRVFQQDMYIASVFWDLINSTSPDQTVDTQSDLGIATHACSKALFLLARPVHLVKSKCTCF